MKIDAEEVAEFKAALRRTSLEGIRRGLDDNVISRAWKRKLAEDEPARRQRIVPVAERVRVRKLFVSRRVWAVLIALILAAIFFIVVSSLGLWHG